MKLLLLSLVFILPFETAFAERIQTVDQKSSKLVFSLTTPLTIIQGRIRKFSGELRLNEREITKSKVSFQFGTVDADFTPVNGGFDLTPLLASLPPQQISFESTSIIPTKKANTYKVKGNFKVGKKKGTTTIPVTLTREKEGSVAVVKMDGAIDDPGNESPIPIIPGQTNGAVEARVVFR